MKFRFFNIFKTFDISDLRSWTFARIANCSKAVQGHWAYPKTFFYSYLIPEKYLEAKQIGENIPKFTPKHLPTRKSRGVKGASKLNAPELLFEADRRGWYFCSTSQISQKLISRRPVPLKVAGVKAGQTRLDANYFKRAVNRQPDYRPGDSYEPSLSFWCHI